MGFHTLTHLADPYWERQTGESVMAFRRFELYLKQPRDKRQERETALHTVAESENLTYVTVWKQARAHRWNERAAAYDADRKREREQWIKEREHRVAEAAIVVASEQLMWIRDSIRHHRDAGSMLTPEQIQKVTSAMVQMSKMARDAPDEVVAITGPGGGPIKVDIPELEGLSPEQQRARFVDMLSGVARLDEYRQRETA